LFDGITDARRSDAKTLTVEITRLKQVNPEATFEFESNRRPELAALKMEEN